MRPSSTFSPVVMVPHYEHDRELANWVGNLAACGVPAVVIDDGSSASCQQNLRGLVEPHASITLLQRASNDGKGAASTEAMHWAAEQGYSHVVSMDADGQHHLPDLPRFLEVARATPNALVSGAPIFGDDIPASRLHGRKITNRLVQLEAGRRALVDAMCGYRVYPLIECQPLLAKLGKRTYMQFDVELMVRAAWAGLPVHYVPTPVRYPAGGRSHFRMVQDNALLTAMHIRLLLAGALWHLPNRALRANTSDTRTT